MRWLIVFLFLVCGSSSAFAQTVTSPKPGDPQRKAILDVLRVPVEKDLKKKVVFQVDRLKVAGEWAFLIGKPRLASGKPMVYTDTRYAEAQREGAFDDWICALLQRRKDARGKSVWRVVRYAIGATDVVYEPWPQEFNAPPAIFK